MKKTRPLPLAVYEIVKQIVNSTPDGSAGYAEAANMVTERWSEFADAGMSVAEVEKITALLYWRKLDGFCLQSPLGDISPSES